MTGMRLPQKVNNPSEARQLRRNPIYLVRAVTSVTGGWNGSLIAATDPKHSVNVTRAQDKMPAMVVAVTFSTMKGTKVVNAIIVLEPELILDLTDRNLQQLVKLHPEIVTKPPTHVRKIPPRGPHRKLKSLPLPKSLRLSHRMHLHRRNRQGQR